MKLSLVIGLAPSLVAAIWAWRIFASGKLSRFRYLSLLLAWIVLTSVAGTFLARALDRNDLYSQVFLTVDVVRWGLLVSAVLESAMLVLDSYQGFVELGKRLIGTSLAISGLAIATLWALVPAEVVDTLLNFWRFQTYVVYTSLATACLLFGLFAAYFRLRPGRNEKLNFMAITVLLVGDVLSGVYLGAGPEVFYINVGLHFAVFLAGALAFSPAAEPAVERAPMDRDAGVGAAANLEGMNETLLRLFKR